MSHVEKLVCDLQSSHDRHWQVAKTRYESLLNLWERLTDKLNRRSALAQSFVDFRCQADQVIYFKCTFIVQHDTLFPSSCLMN